MGYTEHAGFSRPDFLADQSSAERTSGRQIAWDEVSDDFIGTDGKKALPSGTPVAPAADGRRIIEAPDAGTGAYGLLEGPAHEDEDAAPLSGYGVIIGGVVYEQLVPGITAGIKTALGDRFFFEQYADSRTAAEES
jgi:hypothetical protein